MANTIKCGSCVRYYALQKTQHNKKPLDLQRGHCLARTVYASNKPGDHNYPAGAKTAELPFGNHKVYIVKPNQVVRACTHAKLRA